MSSINLFKAVNIIFFKLSAKIKIILNYFFSVIFTSIFIPLAILIRVIKPLVHIRIGCLRNDVIGNSIYNAEYYLCQKKIIPLKTLDLFYLQDSQGLVNKQWHKMLKKKFKPHFIFRYLDYANNLLYKSNDFKVIFGERDLKGFYFHNPKNFSFNESENKRGKDFLETIGLKDEKDKFICLNIRDEAYKNKFQSHKFMDHTYWNYHNFRNSNIDNYYEAIIKLLDKGYWVIRMGKAVEKKMNINHSKFLDYANSEYREDFLDIWLMANCFFTISGDTGLDEVCKIFRKPIVHINFAFFHEPVLSTHALTSFKLPRYKKNKKFLSLKEIIDKSIIEFHKTEHFQNSDIELIENSPEEITDAIFEMENKLHKKWNQKQEDITFQKEFFKIFKSWKNYSKFHDFIHPNSGISSTFLRRHHSWFLQ
tara:strand:+ start:366 stop:1631 length:1266 start_codon:yes stop_codon:yes gene_type:complete